MSRFEIFWLYFIFNLTENLSMKWVNAQMAYTKSSYFTHLKIDLCDLINEDDILAIRSADKKIHITSWNQQRVLYSCRKSHVDKWGSEFSAGDQILHGYYYKQVGNDFIHQRLVKNIKASVPEKCNLHV